MVHPLHEKHRPGVHFTRYSHFIMLDMFAHALKVPAWLVQMPPMTILPSGFTLGSSQWPSNSVTFAPQRPRRQDYHLSPAYNQASSLHQPQLEPSLSDDVPEQHAKCDTNTFQPRNGDHPPHHPRPPPESCAGACQALPSSGHTPTHAPQRRSTSHPPLPSHGPSPATHQSWTSDTQGHWPTQWCSTWAQAEQLQTLSPSIPVPLNFGLFMIHICSGLVKAACPCFGRTPVCPQSVPKTSGCPTSTAMQKPTTYHSSPSFFISVYHHVWHETSTGKLTGKLPMSDAT